MRAHHLALNAVFACLALVAGCTGDPRETTGGGEGGSGGDETGDTAGGGATGPGGDTAGHGGGDTGGTTTGAGDTGGDGGPPGECKAMWSRSFPGDITQQFVTSVFPDAKGEVLVSGYFEGTVDTGGGVLESDAADIFVVKLDSAGNHLWTRKLGGPMNQYGMVVPDGQGGFVLTGQMEGSMDLGAGPLTSAGEQDAFVARFDADGKLLWNKVFGGHAHQGATQARVDAKGNIVFAGNFQETLDLGGVTLTSAGDHDVYVVKLDPDGNVLWGKAFGDAGQQLALPVDLDGDGNIVVGGFFTGAIDLGGSPLESAGAFDVFVAKLDANGDHLWSHRFGNAQIQTAGALVTGPSGNVFLTGTFQDAVDFGGGPLKADPGLLGDIFVVELDAAGKHVRSHGLGGDGQRNPYSIAVDSDGNPVLTGVFTGALDVGGTTLSTTSPSDYDIFVAKVDAAGKHLYSGRFGDAEMQTGSAVAIAAPGQPILAGSFDGAVDFGEGPLVNGENDAKVDFDFFLTRLACNPAH